LLIGDGLMAISQFVILLAPVVWPVLRTVTLIGAKTELRHQGMA
jgi:hypothetical protein